MILNESKERASWIVVKFLNLQNCFMWRQQRHDMMYMIWLIHINNSSTITSECELNSSSLHMLALPDDFLSFSWKLKSWETPPTVMMTSFLCKANSWDESRREVAESKSGKSSENEHWWIELTSQVMSSPSFFSIFHYIVCQWHIIYLLTQHTNHLIEFNRTFSSMKFIFETSTKFWARRYNNIWSFDIKYLVEFTRRLGIIATCVNIIFHMSYTRLFVNISSDPTLFALTTSSTNGGNKICSTFFLFILYLARK